MPRLSIETLGALHVTLDGRPVTAFESDKVRALLVYLAVESAQPHRREQLAGLLWPELPETHARGNLRQSLYNLRGALGDRSQPSNREPYLLVAPQSIQFDPNSDHWLDVSACSVALARSESHPHRRLEACETCMADLEAAVALYKGDFLADFSLEGSLAFEEWALFLRERLRRRVMVALKQLAVYHEGRGSIQSALRYTRRALEIDPLWEAGHRSSMRLLALDGQHQAALAQYESCRRMLADELGIEPDPATRALYTRIHAEAQGAALTGDLPAHLTPFVGRQGELAELRGLLLDPGTRLVTVLGPGGSGKTRLALQVARGLRYDFADGVYLVQLSALSSQDPLIPAVAEALGFTFQEQEWGSSERLPRDLNAQLHDYLRDRHILLIFDGFETVLGGAVWLAETLRATPQLKALVTSRARLNLRGEQRFSLAGMRYPHEGDIVDPARHSAVELFITAARRVRPGFDPSTVELADIARICRLMEGMPLGLLLAAVWVDTYSLEEMTAQIEGGLDFLSADWADVPARERSLRATLDYSWELLEVRGREICARLSVFRGSFTQEAAGRVVGARVSILQVLVDKCMLEVTEEGRWRMHDLVRQYAAERLAESPETEQGTREKHSVYYLGKLPGWERELKSSRQPDALAAMDLDVGNLEVAWTWAVQQAEVERLDAALEGLALYYALRFRYLEGTRAMQIAAEGLTGLEETGFVLRTRAWLMIWGARFMYWVRAVDSALDLLENGRALFRRAMATDVDACRVQAFYWHVRGDIENALERRMALYQQSIDLYQGLDHPYWLAELLTSLGLVCNRLGEPTTSMSFSTRSLEICRSTGEPRGLARALRCLSHAYAHQGQIDLALQTMREAVGDPDHNVEAYLFLSITLLYHGRFAEVCDLLEKGWQRLQGASLRPTHVPSIRNMGLAKMNLGEYSAARSLAQTFLELAQAADIQREVAAALFIMGNCALAQGDLHQARGRLQESVDIYRNNHYISELGWVLGSLGCSHCALGLREQAWANILEALRYAVVGRVLLALFATLPTAALLLAGDGRIARAIEVYTSANQAPLIGHSRLIEDIAGRHIAALAKSLPRDEHAAAEARGRQADIFDTAAELLEEFGQGVSPGARV